MAYVKRKYHIAWKFTREQTLIRMHMFAVMALLKTPKVLIDFKA